MSLGFLYLKQFISEKPPDVLLLPDWPAVTLEGPAFVRTRAWLSLSARGFGHPHPPFRSRYSFCARTLLSWRCSPSSRRRGFCARQTVLHETSTLCPVLSHAHSLKCEEKPFSRASNWGKRPLGGDKVSKLILSLVITRCSYTSKIFFFLPGKECFKVWDIEPFTSRLTKRIFPSAKIKVNWTVNF